MNQDMLTGSMGNSQSLNRYSYVQGNPVSYTDPFGLSPLAGLFTGTTLIHLGLGILGCVPGIGIAANLADAAVYAYIDHDYFAASMATLDCVTMGAAGMCSLLKTGSMLGKLSKCVSIAGDIVSNTMNFATMSVNWFEHKWDSLDDKQKATAIVCAVAGVTLVAGGIALGSYIKHIKESSYAEKMYNNLNDWANNEASRLSKISNRQRERFNTASIAYDKTTRKYYYGRNNGININSTPQNPILFGDSSNLGILPEYSFNTLKVGNCSEVDAINNALNDGARLENLYISTIHTTKSKFGSLKEACQNCTYAFKGRIIENFAGWFGGQK